MDSIWHDGIKRPKFPTLKGDKRAEVLIIGGGMAGILCTHLLKSAGVDCILVEADRICSGITQNTTAKITMQHGLIYDKLIKNQGKENAQLYWELQQKALEAYGSLCQNIDCDFKWGSSFVYSRSDRAKIEREAKALEAIGSPAMFQGDLPLPFPVAGAVGVPNQAQFHPLMFAFSLAQKLPIYEKTKILELKPGQAVTKNGSIRAKKIIVATHFPFLNKHGAYFLKLYQHRSYVLALEGAPVFQDMYVDEALEGLSFRGYQDLLLLGGGSHRTGKHGGNWQELRDFAKQHYPEAKERCHWATQDCMSLDGVPYIGQYAKGTPELFVATGFNKWGMTSAMAAAMILTDLVRGKENHYAKVFDPSRSILHPQLFVNGFESATNLLTPTAPRCPHLGCALKYNPREHSWDCPCHGSRFTEQGELIDNPATDDKKM